MNSSTEKTLRYLMFAGLAIAALTIIVMAPWGNKMGAAGSPQRMQLIWVYSIVGALPFAIYFMYMFAKRAEWNAAPGSKVVPAKASPFARHTFIAIGAVGVVFAIAWMVRGIPLDFLAIVMAASVSLFGGIVSFFGLLIGQAFAELLGLINPLWAPAPPGYFLNFLPLFIYDASIYAFAGYAYFKYVYQRGTRPFLPAFLTAWILAVLVVQIAWLVGDYIIYFPGTEAKARIVNDWFTFQPAFPYLPYWLLLAVAYYPIGFLLGHLVRRALKRRE